MNPSSIGDTHQQQQHQHQQNQQHQYDPSQLQAYDPYYTYSQQHNPTQQNYPYYPSEYTNLYHQQPQQHYEPTSIHPPGVPIPPESSTHLTAPDYAQAYLQNQQNAYYPQGIVQQEQQQQQWQGNGGGFVHNPPIGQSYRGGGRRGGKSFRGRGRGRGQFGTYEGTAAFSQGPQPSHAVPLWPPPRMAWCELCRVDCNTSEILEQHKNGKKHKKNLQVYEELQNLNRVITGMQNQQMPISESNPEVVQSERVDGSGEKQALTENLPFEISVAGPTNEAESNSAMNHSEAWGRGSKRNMRGGGRGGKRMRTSEPPKPKQVIPFICDLCNVKCESQVVLDSHLAGRKHLSNFKRFHGYQAVLGAAVLQALCQANPNIASTSFIPQVHQQGNPGPQGYLSQPNPYMLPQFSAPAPAPTANSAPVSSLATEPSPATALTSTPIPVLETDDHQDSKLHGSQDITAEADNESTATVEAESQQHPVAVEAEAAPTLNGDHKTENGTSDIEEEEAPSQNEEPSGQE